jgi:hypothetical protein
MNCGINHWFLFNHLKSIAMNKLFIGLLIVAAGAGAFFFLRKKKSTTTSDIKKEWIVGKWKVDSFSPGKDSSLVFLLYATDSNSKKEIHHFYEQGLLVTTYPYDSLLKNDTAYYEWNKNKDLIFKGKVSDSTAYIFSIEKLTKDSLQVQSKDSATILFTKLK